MENIEELKIQYILLEERIRSFILVHSDLEYVQGSNEIVEGGAFTWTELSSESKALQLELWREYISISRQARKFLAETDSPHLELFEESFLEVKTCLKQNGMLWGPCLQDIFRNMKKELDLQRSLVSQVNHLSRL
ncbi:hypothetical protein [Paenibacillus brevis]|uniref:Uncharacterized protein n=1 Tax=Paenibacillus brevis TaxID=2841508 RepID=A0ABS6FSC7_9BACL|nr:hypothetical protein [Paenibacillus brevis]MBU5672015.1 hypothetical protein [Paenibacillus brevis]